MRQSGRDLGPVAVTQKQLDGVDREGGAVGIVVDKMRPEIHHLGIGNHIPDRRGCWMYAHRYSRLMMPPAAGEVAGGASPLRLGQWGRESRLETGGVTPQSSNSQTFNSGFGFLPHVSFGGHRNVGLQIGVNNGTVNTEFRLPSSLEAKLPIVPEATFNSFADQHDDECHPGTRTDLLQQIEEWALSPETCHRRECIFWLNGMAGTGKSTISRTVATRFSKENSLGASFFFKRGEGNRGNATRFVSTVARELAASIPELIFPIEEVVREDPGIATKSMTEQFDKLILRPLHSLKSSSRASCLAKQTMVIVIDALDECQGDNDIRLILNLLPQLQQSGSPRLRVFITSRPEMEIRLDFSKILNHKDFILHEIPRNVIEEDLSLFLNHRLSAIKTERSLPDDWPRESSVLDLISLSSPLFIFAATICRMLEDRRFDPVEILSDILESPENISKLDKTYLPVLNSLLYNLPNKKQRDQVIKGFQQVVGAIVMLENPLSIESLSKLLNIPERTIQIRLDLLHSVLKVPEDKSLQVRLFHLSFRDFLLDDETPSKTPFWVDSTKMHFELAKACLSVCGHTLRKNICKLPTDGTPRSDLDPATIDRHIPPEVQYGCRYWANHLGQFLTDSEAFPGGEAADVFADALEFLQKHFMHWMEAMSILGLMPEVIGMVNLLLGLSPCKTNPAMSSLLSYARRFVLKYSQIADEAPLQIYSAGLIFAPQNAVRKLFDADLPSWLAQLPQVAASWSSEIQVLEGHEDTVFNVAFSSDSRVLVSASALSIRIWDHSTGTLQHCLPADPSDQSPYHLIVLSPDGQLLVSSSQSGILKLWDTVTGVLQETFSSNSSHLGFTQFSPDSRLLTYVSRNGQLQLFDTQGTLQCHSFNGSSVPISSLAFSPDSLYIGYGYTDGVVKICELATGNVKHRFKCHTKSVYMMAFSPDGLLLASISEDQSTANIRSISRDTPKYEIDVDPHGPVLNMVFSPNSQKIVFETRDGTKCWDLRTGDRTGVLNINYSERWRELAFSPDSTYLVAAGLIAVFIWDCQSKPRKLAIHSDLMHSAALAKNSQSLLLASGCKNGTVRLWGLKAPLGSETNVSGASEIGGLWTSEMTDLLFSHGGRLLASTSSRGQIVIWDVMKQVIKDEIELQYPFDGKVAFAYDSPILAITQTKEILLWDLLQRRPLKKHLNFIDFEIYYEERPLCLAVSRNGQVAFSLRHKIRLWDMETGAKLHYWKLDGNITTLEFLDDGPYLRTNFGILGPGEDVFSQNSLLLRSFPTPKIEQVRKQLSSTVPLKDDGTMIGEESTTKSPRTCDQDELQVSVDNQWIMLNQKRVLWLPPDVRPQAYDDKSRTRIAIHGRRVALPHSAGHVCFVEFRP
ncbi:NACHT and WD40 domain protein [Penicillium verhagenii]|uniref:NACHT and WD40 domain protein n=1 Tax=Penicillium verhagenii TaxID=1562060 RepID=UPI002544DE23|nr:NACHT and WD40 domain protein [Penicillium verhagenii]KAJ5920925.1 NACHT and WD40 domain protein [Penicillium verhagenii]